MQFMLTSTVVTIIVSTLVLLFEPQYPFRSEIGVGPEVWDSAVVHIRQMQEWQQPDMKM